MVIPLYNTYLFSLSAFIIFPLCLIFLSDYYVSHHSSPGCILYGTLCASWHWVIISFLTVGKIFYYNLLKYFIRSLFIFFFRNPFNFGAFNVAPEVYESVLIDFILFLLFCSTEVISTIFSSR